MGYESDCRDQRCTGRLIKFPHISEMLSGNHERVARMKLPRINERHCQLIAVNDACVQLTGDYVAEGAQLERHRGE